MNVEYSDELKTWDEGFALAQKGTKLLLEAVEPSNGTIDGDWDSVQDEQGRRLLSLRLKDYADEVVSTFAPEDLSSASRIAFRMHLLLGKLFHARTQKQLDSLLAAGERQ